jgi:2',3'-cyclic-nucleotide 2'-phosphodiesterase (5'-nucleotidase family)
VKLEMRGADLRQVLEQGLAELEREGGGFLQVSGITFTYDPARPPGQRVLSVEIGGARLDEAGTYVVAANDYILRGGDGHTALGRGRVLVGPENGPALSAIVLDAVTRRGTISPQVEGRIRK